MTTTANAKPTTRSAPAPRLHVPKEETQLAPGPVCLAMIGDDYIDAGKDAEAFVEKLRREWTLADEDIAVWLDNGQGGTRLVAVLRPQAGNRVPSVTWL